MEEIIKMLLVKDSLREKTINELMMENIRLSGTIDDMRREAMKSDKC